MAKIASHGDANWYNALKINELTKHNVISMVKRQSLMSKEKIHHCPVGCVLCNHPTDYPARFVPFALPASQSIRHISNKSNHILFLIDGSLHVVLENKNIYIQAGQALFFGRNTCPYIRATHDSTIVWLKFSNRIVLGGSDVLSKVAAANRPSHEDDIPILDLTQTMIDKLRGMQFIDSPCYHISRQYELYIAFRSEYSEEQMAQFFSSILRARDDFRAFVKNNYRYGDTLEKVAQKANMSTNHFLRKFKEHFGMTAHQWMVKQKAEKLVKAIQAGETNAKLLADRFGFHSTAGLYLFCRRQVGMTFQQLTRHVADGQSITI